MLFNKIILVSDTPKNTGLAYYYTLALKDTISYSNIILIDNISLKLNYFIFFNKYLNFLHNFLNIKAYNIYNSIKTIISSNNEKDVIIFFNNGGLNKKYLNKIKNFDNLYLINFLSDHPYGLHKKQLKILKQNAHIFDLFITFSKSINPILYRFGANNVYNLPFAYCKYTHFIKDKDLQILTNNEIHYFGTWTKEIEDMLLPLQNYNLYIHGSLWRRSNNKILRTIALSSNDSYYRNMIKSANNAKIVINFTRAPHMCLHTMKTFELTIAGACVISNYSEEQNFYFPDNDSMIYFNTKEEMVKKINYYLSNNDENFRIRKNARLKAKENNYHNRSKDLINYLNKL